MTQVNKYKIDNTREGSKNLFYDVTNQLSKEEFANFQSDWEKIEIFGPIENSTVEDIEKINDSLKLYKDEILQVFDFFITSLEIVQILYSGIQSLMSLVVNYIYETIYNQLDMLLRTGVYSLTVVPDFQDARGFSLPTTSLSEQAENAYKKFYDFKDPDVPYAQNFSTEATDAFKTEGDNFIGRLNALYDKESSNKYVQDNSGGDFFKLTSETNKPYFESNFQDLAARMELLSKPGGTYEGIFLYFSFDLRDNLQSILDFVDAIGKFAFFFENKSLHRISNRVVSRKVKQIRVVTRRKLENIEMSEKLSNEKIITYDNKSYSYDKEMKDKIFVLPFFEEVPSDYEYDDKKSPSGSKNFDSSLPSKFDQENKATILSCETARKEEKQTKTIYYRYIDRINDGWGNSFSNKTMNGEMDSLNDEFFIYDFTIELDKFKKMTQLEGVTAPFQQDFDYFNENQKIGIFNGDEFLGQGYILKNVPRATTTDTKGSWFGTSFTDLIGVSDNIKNLQYYVAGKRNSFESNLFGLDELIADLKTLKSDIVRMIDMLDSIINLLKISINFDGAVYAKYVREENYDKFATYLTDYSTAPPTPKQIFKPSANANIRRYIKQIKELQERHPDFVPNVPIDQFIEEMDEDYGNDETPTKDLDSYFDVSKWKNDPDEVETIGMKLLSSEIGQGGLIAGPVIVEQLSKKIAEASHELGSAIYDLVKPISTEITQEQNIQNLYPSADSVPTTDSSAVTGNFYDAAPKDISNYLGWDDETTREYIVKAKYNNLVLQIKEELSRATADLSREFGFSQIFVTYLPKGFKFQPIALLADRLNLVDQHQAAPPETEMVSSLDRNSVNEKIPTNTIPQSEGILKSQSQAESTTINDVDPGIKYKITVSNFEPFYDNETVADKNQISISGNQLQILAPGVDIVTNKFGVRGVNLQVKKEDSAGTVIEEKSGKGMKILINDSSNKSEDYIYVMEYKITITVNRNHPSFVSSEFRPRYSKIRVNAGFIRTDTDGVIPYRNIDTTHKEKAFINNNDDGSDEFKFGQLKEKIFSGKLFFSNSDIGDKYIFYPYFTIGYNGAKTNKQHFGEGTTFEIANEITFYRTS